MKTLFGRRRSNITRGVTVVTARKEKKESLECQKKEDEKEHKSHATKN